MTSASLRVPLLSEVESLPEPDWREYHIASHDCLETLPEGACNRLRAAVLTVVKLRHVVHRRVSDHGGLPGRGKSCPIGVHEQEDEGESGYATVGPHVPERLPGVLPVLPVCALPSPPRHTHPNSHGCLHSQGRFLFSADEGSVSRRVRALFKKI